MSDVLHVKSSWTGNHNLLFMGHNKYVECVSCTIYLPWVCPKLVFSFTSEITHHELCTVSERTLSTSNFPSGDQRICYHSNSSSLRLYWGWGSLAKRCFLLTSLNAVLSWTIYPSPNCVYPCSSAVIMNADDGLANWTWINMYTFFSFHMNMLFIPRFLSWGWGGWICPFEDSITTGGEKGVAAFWAQAEWAICRTNRRLKLLLDLMGMKRVWFAFPECLAVIRIQLSDRWTGSMVTIFY